MKIGILGTGTVATALATNWTRAGHEVTLGSRDPGAVSSDFTVASHADAVAQADVVVNATPGAASVDTLSAIGADAFAGKVLLDASNGIARGEAGPELAFPNANLAATLQAALPGAKVVKSLNTVGAAVMADPSSLSGASSVFVSGDDEEAKKTVTTLLTDLGFAPEQVVDLGGIASARGAEHFFLLFVAIAMASKGAPFNISVVR